MDDPRTGGVTAVQRFGGAINLNVHFHTLVPDGVFAFADDGTSRFVRLPALRDEDAGAILRRVIRKVARIIQLDADGDFEICDSFAALQAAEIDRRLRFPDPFRATRRSAHLDGFSLHAGVRVHENDRLGLEMKRSRGGSLFLVLTPAQLLARIATLVPPPRTHAIRYHGLFAPNARARSKVVPASTKPTVASGTAVTASAGGDPDRPFRLELTTGSARETAPNPCAASAPSPVETRGSIRYRVPWAELLQKVFAADVLACPDCGGRLRLIAFVSAPAIAKQILDHLGIDSQAPPLAKARTVDEVVDAAPEYDCIDPVYGGE